MSRLLKQVLIGVFFFGQLGLVWWLNQGAGPAQALGVEEALDRHGFFLRDVARESGIDFVHESPCELDKRLDHILPIIASMGASVSVVDYDKDGWLDLYVVNSREGSKNRLYRNLGNGQFEDVAEKLGVADLNQRGTGVCQGAIWGDINGDGYEDLFVYKWGKPELFRNDQGKGFTRVTEASGLPKWVNANAAVWLDFDRDGHLDLFLAGYWADDVNLWNLSTTRMMPTNFEYARNGGNKYLLRNRGDGTFEDVSEAMGVKSTRWALAAAVADLCGSGYPDIVVANDYGVPEFWCNLQGQRFQEIGQKTGIGLKPKSGMNVTMGDISNTGRLSLYITNISEPGNLVQGNFLFVPQKHQPGVPPRYYDLGPTLKVDLGGWSWGAQFGDLNNDGFQDLYLTNGYISAGKDSYWYDYGLIAGGNSEIIKDALTWPAMKGRSLSGFQRKCLWLNRGGEFIDIAGAVGVTDVYDGRSVVLADLFNRGVLDVVVANQNGPLLLYKNTVASGRNWVQFELQSRGGNTSAIGALVRCFWRMEGQDRLQEQVQVITGGNGYASQNMRRLHFGLGKNASIEKVILQWPSGQMQTILAPKVDTLHRFEEPAR